MFLQREEPLIHVLQPQLQNLLKNVLGKFVKPAVLFDSLKSGGLSTVSYKEASNQLDDNKLVIGFMTKQRL